MPARAFAIMHASLQSLLSIAAHACNREASHQLRSASTLVLSGFIATQVSPAAWVVIRLVPYMAHTLRAVVTDLPETADDFGALASMLINTLTLLNNVGSHCSWSVCSWEQLADWAAAADAGLHMLATLAEAQGSCDPSVLASLPVMLLRIALVGAELAANWCQDNPVPQERRQALVLQLWQLHTSAARLMHWSAGSGPLLLLAEQARQAWPPMLFGLIQRVFMLVLHTR